MLLRFPRVSFPALVCSMEWLGIQLNKQQAVKIIVLRCHVCAYDAALGCSWKLLLKKVHVDSRKSACVFYVFLCADACIVCEFS